MFESFFPRPKWFFWSLIGWTIFVIALWYTAGRAFGAYLGMPPAPPGAPPIIGVQMYWSKPFLWFDIYYWIAAGLFAAFWRTVAPHPWWRWSILGSALILWLTYVDVEVNVAINNWYGPFYDMIQAAASHTRHVSLGEFYGGTAVFLEICLIAVIVGAGNAFFISHFCFRWRAAMNQFYIDHWPQLRGVEGAAQRVQDDTKRFAETTEDMGTSFIRSVMTLIAFLPLLVRFSVNVTTVPILGHIPYPLVIVAILRSLFGPVFLASIGLKLHGIYFRNQRVEAAYRKELVYGEDHADRAQPPTLEGLFANIRKKYFKLYFHYAYFNMGRIIYLQTDNIFGTIVLAPSIVAGAISFGLYNQITGAFSQVSSSFQYLVNSWATIVELQSIYRRLRSFESVLHDEPLPQIEAMAH